MVICSKWRAVNLLGHMLMWKNITPNLWCSIMVDRLSCPKVSGGTAIIWGESNLVGNKIVRVSVGRGSIIPVYGDNDDVGLGDSKDCALESLSGSGISVVAALSALSLLA